MLERLLSTQTLECPAHSAGVGEKEPRLGLSPGATRPRLTDGSRTRGTQELECCLHTCNRDGWQTRSPAPAHGRRGGHGEEVSAPHVYPAPGAHAPERPLVRPQRLASKWTLRHRKTTVCPRHCPAPVGGLICTRAF